jgi:ABC-type transport system involved in multi-copper enzyme maturation permease subunit
MKGALRVLRAEWMRLVTARSAQVAVALLFIVPALRVAAKVAGKHAEALERQARGIKADSIGLDAGTAWAPFVEGWRAGLVLGLALLLVQAARSVAGDRESGVLRIAVTRSASRTGALVGRALLGPLMVLCIVLLSGLGALAAASTVGDFGPLVVDNYTITSAADLLVELRSSLLVTMLGLMAVHAFGILVSTASRGAVIALAASLATILLWDVFKSSLGDARWWFFASHAPTFIDGSAMSTMVGVAEGYSDKWMEGDVFHKGVRLAPLSALLFVAASALLLRRRVL